MYSIPTIFFIFFTVTIIEHCITVSNASSESMDLFWLESFYEKLSFKNTPLPVLPVRMDHGYLYVGFLRECSECQSGYTHLYYVETTQDVPTKIKVHQTKDAFKKHLASTARKTTKYPNDPIIHYRQFSGGNLKHFCTFCVHLS